MLTERVLVTAPGQVALDQIEIADAPGLDQVAIQTEVTFVSAGTELANFTALDKNVWVPGAWCSYPWAAGYANVGRIIARGDAVTDWELGTRVFSFGPHQGIHYRRVGTPGLAQTIPSFLEPVPDGLDPALAAMCCLGLVAASSLSVSQRRLSDVVGVWGLGLVGNIAAQLWQLAGCRVAAFDPIAARRRLARDIGLSHVGSPSKSAVEEQLVGIGAGYEGFDSAIDAVGDAAVINQLQRHVRLLGQIILLGTPRRSHQTNLEPLASSINRRGLRLTGSLQWLIPLHPQTGFDQSTAHNLSTLFDLVGRGRLKLAPLLTHHLPPAEIGRAYEGLLADKERFMGVALVWND